MRKLKLHAIFAAALAMGAIAGCEPCFDAGGSYHGEWTGTVWREGDYEGAWEVNCPFSLLLEHGTGEPYPLNRVVTGAASFEWTCFFPDFLSLLIDYNSVEAPLGGYVDEDGRLHLGSGSCSGELFCVTLDMDATGEDADGDGIMDQCEGQFQGRFQILNAVPIQVEARFKVSRAWTG